MTVIYLNFYKKCEWYEINDKQHKIHRFFQKHRNRRLETLPSILEITLFQYQSAVVGLGGCAAEISP